MIKINLLGVARPAAPKAVGPPPTVIRQAVTFAAAVIVAFGILYAFYLYENGLLKKLQDRLKLAQAEQTRLAGIKAENARYQQQLNQLQQRINVIQTLQSSRTGPVDMMNALANTVDRASDLYLLGVGTDGNHLSLKCQANTVESIANFITDLKRSGNFDEVLLHQYAENDKYSRPSYDFTLDCVYKPPASAAAPAAPTQPAPGAPAAPARRAGR